MKSYSDILAALEARKDRSAWDKGVTAYAVDLLDHYQERAEYEGREAASCKELEEWLLNGASTWSEYSWGGSALIYNGDIAKLLCSRPNLSAPATASAAQTTGRNGLTHKQEHLRKLQNG